MGLRHVALVVACIACSSRSIPAAPPAHTATPADATVDIPPRPDSLGVVPTPGKVVVHTADECGLILDAIYFLEGSSKPDQRQTPIFDRTADSFLCWLRTGEVTRWRVTGHADSRERDPIPLSVARATAVASALVARGYPENALDIVGVGASEPIARGATDFAHATNRRVVFLAVTGPRKP